MTDKLYIRVKKDGFLYDWNQIMADNAECEVVTESEAYPERFIPVGAVEHVTKIRAKRKAALDLSTEDIADNSVHTPPELAADASRGLG